MEGPNPGKRTTAATLYILTKPELVEGRRLLHGFIDEFAFFDLVRVAHSLRITHT